MDAAGFKKWLGKLADLNKRQRERLVELLGPAAGLDRVCATIAQARPAPLGCPRCRETRCHRHGHDRGLQRYRCCACGKTFSALTGTPLARLGHRARWLDYLDGMLEATSVRKAASAVGIHRHTSFRWRHRFLALIRHDRPARLTGIAEADEMFLLESQKGSRILVARDRAGATRDVVTGRGALTKEQLHRDLLPVLDKHVLLVTDSHAAYRAFAREAGISHEAVKLRAGERVRGALHVQNVNAYHRRFRQWLARFYGVASRYLPNYLGWHWALDGQRIATPDRFPRAALGSSNTER